MRAVMLHAVPEGYEFWHKGVTEVTLSKAKMIWIKHGNMNREDCVVQLSAGNLLPRMLPFWVSALHAHPEADFCDVVQRMLDTSMYEIDMTYLSRDAMKMDWVTMENSWLAQKQRWWIGRLPEEVARGDGLPRRDAGVVGAPETRSVKEIIMADPCGKHVVAILLFRDARNDVYWDHLAHTGIAGVALAAVNTLEGILRQEGEAEQDIYSTFPYDEMHD